VRRPRPGNDSIVLRIHERIAQYTELPPDHGQELAVRFGCYCSSAFCREALAFPMHVCFLEMPLLFPNARL
jgi:hypothetical protein